MKRLLVSALALVLLVALSSCQPSTRADRKAVTTKTEVPTSSLVGTWVRANEATGSDQFNQTHLWLEDRGQGRTFDLHGDSQKPTIGSAAQFDYRLSGSTLVVTKKDGKTESYLIVTASGGETLTLTANGETSLGLEGSWGDRSR